MEYALIFYTAHKTAYCETALNSGLRTIQAKGEAIVAVTTPKDLGEAINLLLNKYDCIFVVGDLSRKDSNSVLRVLSAGLGAVNPQPICRRIRYKGYEDGYLINTIDRKQIVVLPDDPQAIEEIASVKMAPYLKATVDV
ncbi:hypothetical protein AGMMS50284_2120 [Clostridia bacterium]|nr:hypothetical protein AGMMS50284_2120 [Clostridia bacterium]